jgi:hypothetical protein
MAPLVPDVPFPPIARDANALAEFLTRPGRRADVGLETRGLTGNERGWRSRTLAGGAATMWRSFFLAVGAFLCILGIECLAIDRAVLARSSSEPGMGALAAFQGQAARVISPPEWAPWTLMSAGAVVLLYSFTIPKRMGGGGP